MFSKILSIAALATTAYAQGMNLTQALSSNNQTSQLATVLGGFPALVNQLGGATNVTLLAPSNNALAALLNSSIGSSLASNPGLLQAVLQYHVLNGTYMADMVTNTSTFIPSALTNTSYTNVTGGQRVEAIRVDNNVTFFTGLLQNSSVVEANVNFTGGVIHVINKVLTLPANVSETLVSADLTSLYGALNATNLLNTVNGLRDVTIFAPDNTAFQRIGSALASASMVDLKSILSYHCVSGPMPYYSSNLMNNTMLQTVNGANVTIHAGSNGTLFVNGARVVTPNVLVAGGVVHVIDNVLNPNATSAAVPTASSGTAAFSGATSVSNAPFTSGVATPTSSLGGGATGATGATSTSSKAAAVPMMTGAVGMGALFGAGAAVVANL